MFEQSIYDTEMPAPLVQEGDLFAGYEIKSWAPSPRLYKILAMSVVANLFALLIFAQTSVLTMKGCDSPLVGRVCEVLDTVYLGAMLFGTPREYVDADYDKTELGEADITFVDVGTASNAPLSYPEGYFQLANPEEFAMLQQETNGSSNPNSDFIAPGIPTYPTIRPSTGNSLINTKPRYPKPRVDVIDGELPGIDDSTVGDTKVKGRQKRVSGGIATANPDGSVAPTGDKTTANPTVDANTVKDKDQDKKVDPTAPVSENDINKKPFVDLGNYVNDLLDKNQVKLDTQFLVNATGKLNKSGKLDPKSFKFITAESSDAKMIEVIKESIEAISASGYLQYLKDLSGKDLTFQIQQDDQNLTALVQSELDTETRARTISSILNALIDYKKRAKEGPNADQNDKDDLVLLQGATVKSDGKKIVITFNLPKADVQKMVERKLAEQKLPPKKQDGNTLGKTADNTAKN